MNRYPELQAVAKQFDLFCGALREALDASVEPPKLGSPHIARVVNKRPRRVRHPVKRQVA
jgi:hypothetical protein